MDLEIKNAILGKTYSKVLKPIMFHIDPEKAHNIFVKLGKSLGSREITKNIVSAAFNYSNPLLSQNLLGIEFKNPVGLSAGFDKNAELLDIMPSVGFGFEEIGSVTAKSCNGNSGTRLKRIPEKSSIWVNLGLNNEGVDKISKRLRQIKSKIPIAVSIAKTNSKETVQVDKAIEDYIYSIEKLEKEKIGDFYVLNISCPNSFGGQPFSNPKLFKKLMNKVSKLKISKPILVKLSPDMPKGDLDKILVLSKKSKVSGFICTNLTKQNVNSGGLSGKALEEKSNNLISYVYKKTKGKSVIVGVGGIFTAEDAYKKIKLGASLVSLITGMIYKGPTIISEINNGLVQLLKKDNFSSISQAIGTEY